MVEAINTLFGPQPTDLDSGTIAHWRQSEVRTLLGLLDQVPWDLVSAAELARAGWSVIVLERNAEIGGFIATEERTLPGYLDDTFSSWHPLFVSGPAYAALGELLNRHGLELRNTDGWVTASVADDGYRYGASSARLRAISRSQRSPFANSRSLS